MIFEWPHQVGDEEVDELGRANNEAYLRWMNRAAIAHSAALGWPLERYLQQGAGWVVRRHEIEYLRPVLPGAQLIIRTWVQSFERTSSWRCYAVLAGPDEARVARGRTQWAWIDFHTGRLRRIPPEISAAFPIYRENVFSEKGPTLAAGGE
jgi:acyl-CoA thioester hydrolase